MAGISRGRAPWGALRIAFLSLLHVVAGLEHVAQVSAAGHAQVGNDAENDVSMGKGV